MISPAAAATTTGPLFARARFVDGEFAALEVGTVQRFHRGLGVRARAHGNESKASRPAAHPVDHQIDLRDGAELGKGILQIIFGDIVGKIADKQLRVHIGFRAWHRLRRKQSGFRCWVNLVGRGSDERLPSFGLKMPSRAREESRPTPSKLTIDPPPGFTGT